MLNHENYHDKNRYLTNSKINDFIKSEYYFYQKHIEGSIKSPVTDPLIIGSAVDEWLTKGFDSFKKKYDVVTRRSYKAPTPYRYQLNNTMYEQVESLCKAVESTEVYKDLKDYAKQVILTKKMPLGNYFDGLAGQVDFIQVIKDKIIIVDLKTTQTVKNYYYKCVDYGYIRQGTMYRMLAQKEYGIDKEVFYHLVVEKDPDKIYNTYLYKFPNEVLDFGMRELELIIKKVKTIKKYQPKKLNWADAQDIDY